MLKFTKVLHPGTIILMPLFLWVLTEPVLAAQESTVSTSQPFAEFWSAFRRGVLKNDKASVASMTRFPLAGDYQAPSKAIFLKKYSKIFNRDFRRLVARSKPYVNASGGYSVIYADRLYMSFDKEGTTYKLTEMGAYH
jgi:hypothetical protein